VQDGDGVAVFHGDDLPGELDAAESRAAPIPLPAPK
jgi:hypothetical protein